MVDHVGRRVPNILQHRQNFIAHTPAENRGVIAVTSNQFGYVRPTIIPEQIAIGLRAAITQPDGAFVQNHNAHFIRHVVIERWINRCVQTNGIRARVF